MERNHQQHLYSDHYFEKGHGGVKIKQTLVALAGWLCVLVPIAITVTSYFGMQWGALPTWHFEAGRIEVRLLAVVLAFLASCALIFTVSMTIIQNRKRDRLVEQWPTFDPIVQKERVAALDSFMDERFGDPESRQAARSYRVEPEQNMDANTIQKLFAAEQIADK